jgi:hypothetical protein
MRASISMAVAAAMLASVSLASGPAAAGDRENPHGYGLYSPSYPKGAYRYDPRSWYYYQPGYYPYHASNYWVPRAHMRYRYRYRYHGPRYRYDPAWGYPRPDHIDGCCHWPW